MPYGTVSACIRRGHLFGSTQLLLVAEGSPTTTLNGLRPNIIKCALYEVVKSSVACSPRMLRITTREIAIKHLKVDPPGMVRHAVLPKEKKGDSSDPCPVPISERLFNQEPNSERLG